MYLLHHYEYHRSFIHGSCYTCSPSGHQVTLMWESVIKFQQMQSSRYGQTLSLQVWRNACSPIVGRLEYWLLSEHEHKHTYVCDSSQTPGTMNNDFCPMSMHVKQGILLTLGAHAQRGLRYILALCVCVCVCLLLFSRYRYQTGS